VGFDYRTANCQAHTRSIVFCREERIEEAIDHGKIEANAIVVE
jgi:hypothetical protein